MKKRLDPDRVTIDGVNYYIYRFSAFECANLMGDLSKVASPIIGAIVPVLSAVNVDTADLDKLSLEEIGSTLFGELKDSSVYTALGEALCKMQVSGNMLEYLMRRLLVQKQNISAEYRSEETGKVETAILDADLVDELFYDNLPGMFTLAAHVIRCNYGNFFGKIASRFGPPPKTEEKEATSDDTEPLTAPSFQNLN